MPDETEAICRWCRAPLFRRTNGLTGAVSWQHTAHGEHEPHEATPVFDFAPDDRIGACDFCGEGDPTWELVMDSDFVVLIDEKNDYASAGAWAMCTPCARDYQAGQLRAITARAAKNFRAKHGSRLGGFMAEATAPVHEAAFSHAKELRKLT